MKLPVVNNESSTDAPTGHDILFPPLPYNIHDRAGAALENEALQVAVDKATRKKDDARRAYCPEVFGERYDALRTLAGEIKQHTLDNLDYYVNQFVDNATAAGAQVHFATDAEEAGAIALDIAKREGLSLCVKSKSMVTEETQLVPKLQSAGVETWETDLGEFIIQLDHDAPSHIVTPMIHKDRFDVARAFERELDAEYTEEPRELTQIARAFLRDKYRHSDLGITGANFIVAETGTLVLCTNEGNGRFCSTAPRVHIAFVGIEKLVPTMRNLSVLVKLLARSSTSQPLTVYTHLMTGPRREHEHDGPQQVHIVLVDNGRTKVLADPEYRESLRCIRCGACLNACPVYRKIGGHAYGAVYSGPIGSIITPLFKGKENFKDLPNASSLCGACYEACPVRINIPELLIKLRRDLTKMPVTTGKERMAFKIYARALKKEWSYSMAFGVQKRMLRMKADTDGFVAKAPGPGAGWTDQRDLPAPPKQSFRQWWKKRNPDDGSGETSA